MLAEYSTDGCCLRSCCFRRGVFPRLAVLQVPIGAGKRACTLTATMRYQRTGRPVWSPNDAAVGSSSTIALRRLFGSE